jgi:hypothetical protein
VWSDDQKISLRKLKIEMNTLYLNRVKSSIELLMEFQSFSLQNCQNFPFISKSIPDCPFTSPFSYAHENYVPNKGIYRNYFFGGRKGSVIKNL